jgi:hypothetical protein
MRYTPVRCNACGVHAHEVHAHETYAREMHAREIHVHEVQTHKMHAHKVYAHEVLAYEIHPGVFSVFFIFDTTKPDRDFTIKASTYYLPRYHQPPSPSEATNY